MSIFSDIGDLFGLGVSAATAPSTKQLSSIATSGTNAASYDASTSADQLAWARNLYGSTADTAQNYLNTMADNSTTASAASGTALGTLGGTNQTLDEAQTDYGALRNTAQTNINNASQYGNAEITAANNYGSSANADALAGQAVADTASANTTALQASQRQLESYGIDPSQTRYGALNLSSQVSNAAAEAAAGTTSRQNTFNTANTMKNTAYSNATSMNNAALSGGTSTASLGNSISSTGLSEASLGNSLSNTSTSAATAGNTAIDSRASTFGSLEGTGTTWAGLQNSALSDAATAASTAYKANSDQSNSLSSGLGDLVGSMSSTSGLGGALTSALAFL